MVIDYSLFSFTSSAGSYHFKTTLECWSIGVLEYWLNPVITLQYSSTPIHHFGKIHGLQPTLDLS
jgi:hypothetical protein